MTLYMRNSIVKHIKPLSLSLLLILLGGINAWGQTDYSGTYYIASYAKVPNSSPAQYFYDPTNPTNAENYYLCPSDGWIYYKKGNNWTADKASSDGPFLTTFKCRTNDYVAQGGMNNAKWVITKHGDYYTFYHTGTSKYLVLSGKISGCGDDRMRVHLKTIDSPETDDNALFTIASDGNPGLYIAPKTISGDRLTVNGGNKDALTGQSGKTGGPTGYENTAGILGIYRGTSTDDNRYFYLEEVLPRPTFTSTSSQIVIGHSEENTTIYYTTDGTNPSATNYAGSGQAPLQIDMLGSSATLKAVAAKSDNFPSCISKIQVIPAASVTLAPSTFTYTGSDIEPTVSSVLDGNTVIPVDEYTIGYSDNKDAGTASVTITDNASGDYIVYGSKSFTINPKPLSITANNKTITYGDAPTNNGVTYGEFAGTETSAVLTGTLTYTYSYEQYGDAGSYEITPSGLSNSNYDITFVAGTLTVNPKEVTVTSGITAADKTYDGTTAATLDGTAAVIEGKIGSDELTVEVGTGTFADKNVGTDKTVTINSFTFGGAKAGNYQMAASGHQATAQASITPATLTVTADAKSKTYGDDDPEFTYTSDGLISPDVLSGDLSRAEGEDAGTYAIGQGTLTAGSNYSITFTSANLTITPKSIGDGNQTAEGITITLTSEGALSAVKDGSTTLEEDADYTYTTVTEGANQFVTVTGIGNYTGSAKALYANPVFTKPAGSDNAATVYKASKDLAKPTGITPYIVRKVNPSIGTITITPLDYIPEGVPVILLSDEEAAGFVASPKEEATPEITDGTKNSNKLMMSQGGETVEAAQIYMFYKGEFVLTKAGTLGTDKYYLHNPNYHTTPSEEPGNSESRTTLEFVIEEETTGIDEINLPPGGSQPPVWRGDSGYSLDGRRLERKPTKSGIYILKGQKVYIKKK